jgi:uncharacterized protein (DUF488 family)
LAPTHELLEGYKKLKGDWAAYERRFLELMAERQIEDALSPAEFEAATALLCSEATAEHCHRRLVCDYLASHWSDIRSVHL